MSIDEVKVASAKKTFKRETGWFLMVLWVIVTVKMYFFSTSAEVAVYEEMWKTQLTWTFLFLAAALGLDHVFPSAKK